MAQTESSIVEKKTSYQTTNTYASLNNLSSNTKKVWLVFHGMGHLSRYFLRSFTKLNPEENFIVAPQAPSKYYLNNDFKYVGASWLTKENTMPEIQNVFNYVDSVVDNENLLENHNLILLGFSQGVSIVTRWMASRKIQCEKLIMYAGSIPNQLKEEDFDHIDYTKTQIHIVYGNQDNYLTPERFENERQKAEKVFRGFAKITQFEGGHEIRPGLLTDLV